VRFGNEKSDAEPAKTPRMRSNVGRPVRANNVHVILSVAPLLLSIDEKLALLREQRPNDPDAVARRDEMVADYESLKCDLEGLRDVAIEVRRGNVNDKAVTKATSTFWERVCHWWETRRDEICTKAFAASLFVSCVGLSSLVGCGEPNAVAVSGVLVAGKPITEALKALASFRRSVVRREDRDTAPQ
jgi:hypothetical protein